MSAPEKRTAHSRHPWLRRLLPLLVLGLGAVFAVILVITKPQTQTSEPKNPGLLVQTVRAKQASHPLTVHAQGNVVPARSIALHAQVSGKVVQVHPNLAPGGVIAKGETLLQIDPSDYRLAVEQRETQLEEARAQLELEMGRQEVAEEEWEVFRETFGAQGKRSELALREPQLDSIRAQVKRAESALAQAKLQLSRTRIDAPFPALVVSESVDVGQLVQPQQAIAQLVGADEFWVRVSVPPDKIPVIAIPNAQAEEGSAVQVKLDLGNQQHQFQGRVQRMEGGLDPRSRMAQLIVSVPNPLGQLSPQSSMQSQHFPLLLDAYVEVVIESDQNLQAIALPRDAVRNGDEAFVFNNGELAIAQLELAWEREHEVLVSAGLEPGAQVVVSNVPAPVAGMKLRRQGDQASSATSSATDADQAPTRTQHNTLAAEAEGE